MQGQNTKTKTDTIEHQAGLPSGHRELELWGGVECTVNRVGDTWFDQSVRSGHHDRIEDLALFAGLGIRSLRYPALWERIAPEHPRQQDFGWTDVRLPEIARLGMNPIVTLCHHGSGPRYTSLLDDGFAPGLAAHAAAVAQRYPWVTDWTPVNEPLTTARFSALYGFWFPHATDERLFWIALLNEIDATRLAMREIRKVNPQARLVQTDDLGYCHATTPLQAAADFQNERRWIGWDLLCGMVVPGHALWDRLAGQGLADRLLAIADDPCPPDVIGINHYLSSERFMDHCIERHPHRALADRNVSQQSGVALVDVDAIRNLRQGVLGLPALLRQAWERYGRPLAVTECHNGATREDQARWFVEIWRGARQLRDEGVDLRAVAAWALLGSYDWNRMVTRHAGHYEPGVFDVRGGTPRPTRMASVLRDLAAGREPEAPGLAVPGWWHRESRFLDAEPIGWCWQRSGPQPGEGAPLLIVGDDGPLTHLALRACEVRAVPYVLCGDDLRGSLANLRPWAVLDARDREGLAGPRRRRAACPHGARSSVARECADAGVPCALFTSAFGPGLAAEGLSLPGVLVARTGPVFTPWDRDSRPVQLLDLLDEGRGVRVTGAAPWHAVYGPDLLDGVLDLLVDEASGAANFFPSEGWTEAHWARQLAAVAGCALHHVQEDAAHADDDPAHAYPGGTTVSLLRLAETTLERFVRESRLARTQGEGAVHRRGDDVRLERAAE